MRDGQGTLFPNVERDKENGKGVTAQKRKKRGSTKVNRRRPMEV